MHRSSCLFFFFFQAEDGIRDWSVTGVQTCALPIYVRRGVADVHPVHHHAEHQVGRDSLGGAREYIRAVRTHEVGDDLATGEVAAEELVVCEREMGRGRILEAPVEAFVAEEIEEVDAEQVRRG